MITHRLRLIVRQPPSFDGHLTLGQRRQFIADTARSADEYLYAMRELEAENPGVQGQSAH